MANCTGLGRGILTGLYARNASRRINPFMMFRKTPGISGSQNNASKDVFNDYFFIQYNTGYINYRFLTYWKLKPVKVWNGSSWVQKPLKFWNGSAWTLA